MTNFELEKHLKKYMSGIQDEFDIVYQETKKIVYLSIYPIITDKDDIEDIMEDTYISMIKSLSGYKFGTSFKAWISKIARNLALNEYKRKKSTISMDETDHSVICSGREDSLIGRSLNLLKNDDKMRSIFIYKIIFNLDFRTIGNIMEIPKSTVSDIYRRAIKIIKDNLEDF